MLHYICIGIAVSFCFIPEKLKIGQKMFSRKISLQFEFLTSVNSANCKFLLENLTSV